MNTDELSRGAYEVILMEPDKFVFSIFHFQFSIQKKAHHT